VSERVTYEQAADVLGCHVSNVPKLIQRGLLTSERRRDGALERAQVEALARSPRGSRCAAQGATALPALGHRPDADHDWLSVRQVAELLGVTKPAVIGRIHPERLPAVENGGRLWVRRDLLEQVEAARLVSKTRRP
jgi:excisionase family DNA binding protein